MNLKNSKKLAQPDTRKERIFSAVTTKTHKSKILGPFESSDAREDATLGFTGTEPWAGVTDSNFAL
jgi:hypothetical protein